MKEFSDAMLGSGNVIPFSATANRHLTQRPVTLFVLPAPCTDRRKTWEEWLGTVNSSK